MFRKIPTALLLCAGGILLLLHFTGRAVPAIRIDTEATLALPPSYTATAEKFQGTEIEYHLNIRGKGGRIYGYFQVINPMTELATTEELEHYLANAQQYKSAQIMAFRSEKKATGNSNGIVWTYRTRIYDENGKGTDIFARQAFTVKNNKIYTLALFAHAGKMPEATLDSDFYKMLSTLSV